MKKMQKVIIALTAILMMLAVPLTAAEMSVRWSWALDDPDVTAYRYQMGGENPEGWTELSGDVSSLELSGLDASAEYTLYLQRSYDGKNWSPSAVSTAKADLDAVPDVRIYCYADYELRAEIYTGSVILSYPKAVSDADAIAFIATENEKYGLSELGVRYELNGDGSATFSYPVTISRETVIAELDRLVADLIEYITTPVEEPVPVVVPVPAAVEEPLVKEYPYAGYTLTATIATGSTLLVYPAFVTDDEVNGFFAHENEKYDLASLGVFYAFGEAGEVTVSYPEIYSKETVAAELDKLVADLIAYITPAAVPVTEPDVPAVIPLTPIAPAEVVEDESLFAFSLLVRGGVLSSFDDTFTFDGRIFADLGLGFDFSHLISAGENFGIGLRSDLDLNFLPKETGKWNLENPLDYFNVFVYGEMVSLDLKVMMEFTAGPADIYIGGGAGFAIGNPFDNPAIEDYLALGTFDIGKVRFSMDWFASATAGVRFYTSDLFSIGAEVNYRYMVESQKHMGSAGIILGFTF